MRVRFDAFNDEPKVLFAKMFKEELVPFEFSNSKPKVLFVAIFE
jgi:hypothetical protein